MSDKIFEAEYTEEAYEQLLSLSKNDRVKIVSAVSAFEILGTKYKNIRKLDANLYEIKPKNVRAYFQYYDNKIIIIGFITLKKTQKAPIRYMKQAVENIKKHIRKEHNDNK